MLIMIEWLNELWYIQTMASQLAMKMKKPLLNTTKWIDPGPFCANKDTETLLVKPSSKPNQTPLRTEDTDTEVVSDKHRVMTSVVCSPCKEA